MDHGKLIAVRMEEARDARGISVAELARRASIDRKRLWYILDGQRQMRADEFVRLCAVMGLDMKFFLTPELREELAWRRQKTIEDYGTGLCGLPRFGRREMRAAASDAHIHRRQRRGAVCMADLALLRMRPSLTSRAIPMPIPI